MLKLTKKISTKNHSIKQLESSYHPLHKFLKIPRYNFFLYVQTSFHIDNLYALIRLRDIEFNQALLSISRTLYYRKYKMLLECSPDKE